MEENSKHTVKMRDNLHPNLEEASGMVPKMRVFEEKREMERERRTCVLEMERVQQEENERGEGRRQREILEDERKKQESEAPNAVTSPNSKKDLEYRMTGPDKEEQAEQQGLLRKDELSDAGKKFLEQLTKLTHHRGEAEEDGEALQDEEEDVYEDSLMYGRNLPETSQNTLSQRATLMVTEKGRQKIDRWNQAKRAARQRCLSTIEEESSEVVGKCLEQLSQTGEAEKDGDALQDEDVYEDCLMYYQDLSETSQNTQSQRATLMVAEKQLQKIVQRCNRNQAKRAARQRCLSTIEEEPSEGVEKCLEQLSHTGDAEEDGDALQDEEEDVYEDCLMYQQYLPETSQKTEEPLANSKKDLNFKQKAFNWLNTKVKERTLQKIDRTYQREAEEGSEPYLPLVRCMASMCDSPLPTRADRERAKREKLMLFEEQRQKFEDRWNQNQAQRAERKEAQKLKEEERYERWSVKRSEWFNQNIGDDEHFMEDRVDTSGSTTAKKRMSIWQKRFLRINCLIG